MDAQAKKKALYRAKLEAHKQKQEKRIDSPLVRYNEFDQPVCRVCDVVLKSESIWIAHQASRKHKEAIDKVKANAAGLTRVSNVKPEPRKELPGSKSENSMDLLDAKPARPSEFPKSQPSSMLPPDFFESHEAKRQKSGMDTVKLVDHDSYKKMGPPAQTQAMDSFSSEGKVDGLSSDNNVRTKIVEIQSDRERTETSTTIVSSETKQVKGALPEGFFDNKDADLRARGIKPVRLDVKDEYKEFEKLIREDLQEVDNRMEEEEVDAAEMIEEAESVEQKTYRERVEMLKKKKMELKAARSVTHSGGPEVSSKEDSSHEESSSDDDSDENFAVDWRAQHL